MRPLKILSVFALAILLTAVFVNTGKLDSLVSPFGILTADGVHPVPSPFLTADGVHPTPNPFLTADGVHPPPSPWGGAAA
jgi:hypothetical protein